MEVDWDVIRTLIGATPFDSFHLHVAGDPGFPPVKLPHPMDRKAQNVRISTWFEDRADFDAVARHANVYFAPRLAEGIGQAVLEAMARGQCVVAPNRPTMNEYIVHGVNGLLYDPHSLESVDFTDVGRLGLEARRGAVAGRRQRQASASKLVDFVVTPSAALYDERRQRLPDGDERSALSAARRVRGVLGRVRRTVRRHLLE
jgi:glycosyltransferase involved in cell wall biosynthesis